MRLETVLVLVTRRAGGAREVLLGVKRRGFGQGRVVAPGGKIEPGESPDAAARRELREETGLVAEVLHPCGVVDFFFPHDGATPDIRAHLVTTDRVVGTPEASDEIDVRWARVDDIPFTRMWPDARHWVPLAVDGTLESAEFSYAAGGSTLERVVLNGAALTLR